MHCVFSGESVNIFARAIHCLAKIGHEIYIQPLKEGLSLRSVNSSRSAYACFVFHESYFQTYEHGISDDEDANEKLKCKLSLKSCLAVFKSLNTIDKMVQKCSIKLNQTGEQLTFLLHCLHGITKTYNLAYQDCETLEAVFEKDLYPNLVNVDAKILNEVTTNFLNSHEEISVQVCPQNMTVTNYVDEETDSAKVIHTKMILVGEEFETFQIGIDTEVTFCLKELKGIVVFAEFCGQDVKIHFGSPGKPIIFSLAGNPTFEATFVLATLVDLPGSQKSQQSRRSQGRSQQEERQSPSQLPSEHEELSLVDDIAFDAEDKWANEIIAQKEEISQTTSNRNDYKCRKADRSFPNDDLWNEGQTNGTNHSRKSFESPSHNIVSDFELADLPENMSVDYSEKSPGKKRMLISHIFLS